MQRLRKFIIAVFLTALTAGLVWAGAELLGQANKSAADAGSNAADLEMASIEFSKPPAEAVNVNWGEINKLRKQMQANTDQYKRLVSGLNGEKASPAVQAQGMKLANAFRDLCERKPSCGMPPVTARPAPGLRVKPASAVWPVRKWLSAARTPTRSTPITSRWLKCRMPVPTMLPTPKRT